jgi:hypothetical protein
MTFSGAMLLWGMNGVMPVKKWIWQNSKKLDRGAD